MDVIRNEIIDESFKPDKLINILKEINKKIDPSHIDIDFNFPK